MAGDASRDFTGSLQFSDGDNSSQRRIAAVIESGQFFTTENVQGMYFSVTSTNRNSSMRLRYNLSGAVPTSLENNPRTMSVQYWRRVS